MFINAQSVGSVTADASGIWQFAYTLSGGDGAYGITATATDAVGNTSVESTVYNIFLDTNVPTVLCKDTVVYLDQSGFATIMAQEIDNGSHDYSGIANYVIDKNTFTL